MELDKAQETIAAAEKLVGKLDGEFKRWSGQVQDSNNNNNKNKMIMIMIMIMIIINNNVHFQCRATKTYWQNTAPGCIFRSQVGLSSLGARIHLQVAQKNSLHLWSAIVRSTKFRCPNHREFTYYVTTPKRLRSEANWALKIEFPFTALITTKISPKFTDTKKSN